MATAAQITANQANARRSTGPRTAEGKAASARNSTSHGLSSQDFVILPGQEAEFEEFISSLRHEIAPVGALELELFAYCAHAAWTLRRCRRAEVAAQFGPRCQGADPLLNADVAGHMRSIDLYTRRAECSFHKSLKALKALQTVRGRKEVLTQGEGPALPLPLLVETHDLKESFEVRARANEVRRRDRALLALQNNPDALRLRTEQMVAQFCGTLNTPKSEIDERTQSPTLSTAAL